MRIARLFALGTLLALALETPSADAGAPTAHRLSFQGLAKNASNQPVYSGDVRVRIYSAATGGTLVYDSGSEFNGAVVTGVFNVVLGSGAALMLDNTLQYYLELDINGQEVVGDAVSGRQVFWPNGGDASRPDLEGRIAALEAQVFAVCSGNNYDLNGNPADGCEFVLDASGIYVDANDPSGNDLAGCGRGPNNTAAGCVPCRSIARGLTEAVSTGRTTVYVANGTYLEAVTLVNGKNLMGGYKSLTWERDLAATNTIIRGESISGSHKRSMIGTGITNPTVLQGFVIYGPNVSAVSGNSYAVYLSNAGGLTVRDNLILGGVAGPGLDGSAVPDGVSGGAGTPGANAAQSPTTGCSVTLNRSGGAGGVASCGGGQGGAGGGTTCPVSPNLETSGHDGVAGAGGGGAGGDAGEDGALSGSTCTLPTGLGARMDGSNGSAGGVGSNGAAVLGASSGLGSVVSSNWVGQVGAAGIAGSVGRGGGGGGAGGGSDATAPDLDIVGATGGGGGSGGCGGSGGNPSTAGGGAFGIFIIGGTAPTITTNTIYRGTGGVGGRGGNGGKGGAGGLGAAGGVQGSLFCSGNGGRGGDGGLGGHGSGAGGSAGGISCGIFTSGIGSPAYAGTNTFSGGAGGAGGLGGASLGGAGGTGVAGTLSTVTSQ